MGSWGGSRSSRSGDSERMSSSSRTVRLGRVEPQAPGFRTIHCNDMEANEIVRFKAMRRDALLCLHLTPIIEILFSDRYKPGLPSNIVE